MAIQLKGANAILTAALLLALYRTYFIILDNDFLSTRRNSPFSLNGDHYCRQWMDSIPEEVNPTNIFSFISDRSA